MEYSELNISKAKELQIQLAVVEATLQVEVEKGKAEEVKRKGRGGKEKGRGGED